MQYFDTKNQAAGAGTLINEVMFVRGGQSRITAQLSGAGTSTVEYTIDEVATVRNNPVGAGVDWIDAGTGPTSTTPVVFNFNTPITAIRLLPITATGVLKGISSV